MLARIGFLHLTRGLRYAMSAVSVQMARRSACLSLNSHSGIALLTRTS